MKERIRTYDVIRTAGRLHSVGGVLTVRLPVAVGEVCLIEQSGQRHLLAEVVCIDGGLARLLPYHQVDGLEVDATVIRLSRKLEIPFGDNLLGRVRNGIGTAIDGKGEVRGCRQIRLSQDVPNAMDRPRIEKPLVTGQRVIDGLLTCGHGQRIGLFAGSGVGKSMLLGEIARGSESDVNVIALIGERGREVRPFLDDCLGSEGLARSVVIVTSSDQSPLMRVRAAQTAVTIASEFRRLVRMFSSCWTALLDLRWHNVKLDFCSMNRQVLEGTRHRRFRSCRISSNKWGGHHGGR